MRRPEGRLVQRVAQSGYLKCLRLYSPLEPYFDKTWKPGEIELVKRTRFDCEPRGLPGLPRARVDRKSANKPRG